MKHIMNKDKLMPHLHQLAVAGGDPKATFTPPASAAGPEEALHHSLLQAAALQLHCGIRLPPQQL